MHRELRATLAVLEPILAAARYGRLGVLRERDAGRGRVTPRVPALILGSQAPVQREAQRAERRNGRREPYSAMSADSGRFGENADQNIQSWAQNPAARPLAHLNSSALLSTRHIERASVFPVSHKKYAAQSPIIPLPRITVCDSVGDAQVPKAFPLARGTFSDDIAAAQRRCGVNRTGACSRSVGLAEPQSKLHQSPKNNSSKNICSNNI